MAGMKAILLLLVIFASSLLCSRIGTAQSLEEIDFFERHVRPIFVAHCQECHGAETQWGSLRVDSRAALLHGGDHGPAIVPGKADDSRLVGAIRRQGDFQMPPEEPLRADQIEAIEQWIDRGAAWPEVPSQNNSRANLLRSHWAFQPITRPAIPDVTEPLWVRNPIDAFVLARLEQVSLSPAPEADRRTLIRRLFFDLTGMPPTAQEVEALVADPAPGAEARVVERLLASPEYAQHWGRLWLDVARYSDTKGYVYGREEKSFIHAHVYRDWVINAFARDLPYDQFIRLQLAADQLTEPGSPDRAALGYLTLGRRFLGVSHDIIDDRIDVVSRGMMGLTVGCARCHDHKYDPISTAEYYSLYGVFLNSAEQLERIAEPVQAVDFERAWNEELVKRQRAFAVALQEARSVAAERMRGRIDDYFFAQTELEKYPQEGFDQILSANDLIPNLVRRLQAYLVRAHERGDRRFVVWHAYASIPPEQFSAQAARVWESLRQLPDARIHPHVASLFATAPPATFADVATAYGNLFADVQRRAGQQSTAAAKEDNAAGAFATERVFLDPADEELRNVLYGSESPCMIPDELMYTIEGLFDSDTCNKLWNLQNEIDRWILQPESTDRFVISLRDRDQEYCSQIFRRGNPAMRGAVVPRQMLAAASPHADDDAARALGVGSGRLPLADQIARPTNPLTARVWVNRIWKQHFGEGLVRTPSDFGLRAEEPSHPELLDWLASYLIDSGWSTKALHRLIVQSATYRQSGRGSHAAEVRQQGDATDPENRRLWYKRPHRLSFEALRDSMLAVSGELDRQYGGRSEALFPADGEPPRRTLFTALDRQFVPSVLRMFDYANPDLHAPQRSETTVPQQSLFQLNHPFVARRAQHLVAELRKEYQASSRGDRVAAEAVAAEEVFRRILQRSPTAEEREAIVAFVELPTADPSTAIRPGAAAWSYGYGGLEITPSGDEDADGGVATQVIIKSWRPIPHFTGSAWQGGSALPDGDLGWVQLTAAGGHPGNDLQHASIRRWTAPRDMMIEIQSRAEHEHEVGDGVRCSIVHSACDEHSGLQKTLISARVHNRRWEWKHEGIPVKAGETLDFVVDIFEVLNTDQYLWQVLIRQRDGDPNAARSSDQTGQWDSQQDFVGPQAQRLDRLEQLAQVLLISNEAIFID